MPYQKRKEDLRLKGLRGESRSSKLKEIVDLIGKKGKREPVDVI